MSSSPLHIHNIPTLSGLAPFLYQPGLRQAKISHQTKPTKEVHMLKSQYKNTNSMKDQDKMYFSKPTTLMKMKITQMTQNIEFKRTITKKFKEFKRDMNRQINLKKIKIKSK